MTLQSCMLYSEGNVINEAQLTFFVYPKTEAAAETAEQEFINRFQKGAMPDEMPEFTFEGEIGLATLLKEAGLVPSTSEAIRSAKQGGVKINGEKVEDMKANAPKGTNVYQVGKRKFARVTIA